MPHDGGHGDLTVTFSGEDASHIRFAARVFGVEPVDVLHRAVAALMRTDPGMTRPARDPWQPVDVYGDYCGQRVEAVYLPATQRVTITTGPRQGQRFKSPSGAAVAAVGAMNPDRERATTNGWRFWRLAETGERLDVLRRFAGR